MRRVMEMRKGNEGMRETAVRVLVYSVSLFRPLVFSRIDLPKAVPLCSSLLRAHIKNEKIDFSSY